VLVAVVKELGRTLAAGDAGDAGDAGVTGVADTSGEDADH
jgi:hypothetical protein